MSELINEFKGKWKVLTFLALLCCCELFFFSSLLANLPIYGVIIIAAILIIPTIILLVSNIKEKSPDKKDLKIFGIFTIVAIICGVAQSYIFIMSLLIAYLFYDDREKLYKWLFIITGVCLIGFIALCFLSVIPDRPIFREDEVSITNIRHTFGFGHPNHPLKFYFSMIIWGYLWLGKTKLKTFIFSLCMLPGAALISYHTNCRTGMMTILGLLILMNIPFVIKWLKTKWIYILFIAVTGILVLCKDVDFVNELLSWRPHLFSLFIEQYPLSILFGKCYYGIFNYPLDNGIMYTLFDGGILTVILIAYVFYRCFKNSNDEKIKVILIATMVYSMFEALITIYANPIYILMFMELLDSYYKNKDNIKILNKKEITGNVE